MFVVAVATLVLQLAHAIVEGHLGERRRRSCMVFFAIWWAWMNFTWFASAYDTDDALYRMLTVVQMAGVLVLAAGVPAAFERYDYRAVTVGYVIMRVGLVGQWVRAAIEHPETPRRRPRYAIGVAVVQLRLDPAAAVPARRAARAGFLVLALAELLVPVWAERDGRDPWHPRHIAERYGLFVDHPARRGRARGDQRGAGRARRQAALTGSLVVVGIAGLVLLVGPVVDLLPRAGRRGPARRREWSFFWGYGHYLLFAALAAVGAASRSRSRRSRITSRCPRLVVGLVLAVPVALVLILLWVLHLPFVRHRGAGVAVFPAAALMVVAALAAPADRACRESSSRSPR